MSICDVLTLYFRVSLMPEAEGSLEGTDEEAVASTTSSSTSIVSSSFRMTITAIETDPQRNLRRLQDYPNIDEKEEPAITEHLTRVFAEVLSIAPTSVSLVFEEDLIVEYLANSGRNFNGVIRQNIFRVMGE